MSREQSRKAQPHFWFRLNLYESMDVLWDAPSIHESAQVGVL
jgi:hypothetical protein